MKRHSPPQREPAAQLRSVITPPILNYPSSMKSQPRIDFAAINRAALPRLHDLCARWLPDGRRHGHEYIALNPRRMDRRAGSFRINLQSGLWADFAIGVSGGDPISLAAYLSGLSQSEAARRLADMLGLRND